MPQQLRRSRRLAAQRRQEELSDAHHSSRSSTAESDETDTTLQSVPFVIQSQHNPRWVDHCEYDPDTFDSYLDDLDDPDSDDSGADMEVVCSPQYRGLYLAPHGIEIRHPGNPIPDLVATHIQQAAQAQPEHVPLSSDKVAEAIRILDELGRGCTEAQVNVWLSRFIFPGPHEELNYGPATGLWATFGVGISRHLMPPQPEGTSPPLPQPKPDILYGYPLDPKPFTEEQYNVLVDLHPQVRLYPLSGYLFFPFLVVQGKAAAGTGGDLWVATNQCAGASVACLRAVDQLNTALEQHGCAGRMANLCYSVAVDNNLAQLYVMWKEGAKFCMQRVEGFLLSLPEHLAAFRHRVLSILEWGRGGRLDDIRSALDLILQARRRPGGVLLKGA